MYFVKIEKERDEESRAVPTACSNADKESLT